MWEYLHYGNNFFSENAINGYLSNQGSDGWELITVIQDQNSTYIRFYFKRYNPDVGV